MHWWTYTNIKQVVNAGCAKRAIPFGRRPPRCVRIAINSNCVGCVQISFYARQRSWAKSTRQTLIMVSKSVYLPAAPPVKAFIDSAYKNIIKVKVWRTATAFRTINLRTAVHTSTSTPRMWWTPRFSIGARRKSNAVLEARRIWYLSGADSRVIWKRRLRIGNRHCFR